MTRRDSEVERVTPGGSYTVTIRADYANKPGMLGRVASVIGDLGGDFDLSQHFSSLHSLVQLTAPSEQEAEQAARQIAVDMVEQRHRKSTA